MSRPKGRARGITAIAIAAVAAAALIAAGCGGTSNADKTSTAAAKGAGTTPAAGATTASTKPATTSTTAASSGSPTAGATMTAGALKIATDATLGKFFTDSMGMTLYIFKNDVANSGKSAGEAVTAVWPPLTADTAPAKPAGATGDFAVITRVDGKKQVTYKGLPLYFFVNDKAAGDTKGQGVAGVWFVAAP